jgi:hypothetical protein
VEKPITSDNLTPKRDYYEFPGLVSDFCLPFRQMFDRRSWNPLGCALGHFLSQIHLIFFGGSMTLGKPCLFASSLHDECSQAELAEVVSSGSLLHANFLTKVTEHIDHEHLDHELALKRFPNSFKFIIMSFHRLLL